MDDSMSNEVFSEAALKEFKESIEGKLIFRLAPPLKRMAWKFFSAGLKFGLAQIATGIDDVFKELIKKGAATE